MELRDYQINQIDFLRLMRDKSGNQLFSANCSLESCTGSGKSIVMLEFIKEYFSKNVNKKVFISTGFNKLVFQFYEVAKQMGIPTEVLIGRNRSICIKNIDNFNEEPDELFTLEDEFTATSNQCSVCSLRKTESCLYVKHLNKLVNSYGNMLIITNHSTLITKEEFFMSVTNGGFIDECQTFGDFYEASMKVEVSYKELRSILRLVENDPAASKNVLLIQTYRRDLERGDLSIDTIRNIMNMATSKRDRSGNTLCVKNYYPRVANEVSKWAFSSKNDPSIYIHPQIEDGRHIGLIVDKFFIKVDMNFNVCLVSATVDSYTKSIFSLNNRHRQYVEHNCNIIDYSQSRCIVYSDCNTYTIGRFLKTQTKDHGLFLSTRLDLVDMLTDIGELEGYKFIKNQEEFIDGQKQILIGSKSLFQGIDISGINFVMINKLPFQRFDESYKKKMAYYESNGYNAYNYYTIPYVTNQLIQAMGRLWRRTGDYGDIALFDGRALNNHKGILDSALSYRDGIKLTNF